MRRKEASIARLPDRQLDRAMTSTHAGIGRISALDTDGRVRVLVQDLDQPVPARLAIAVSTQRIHAAIESRQETVLVFEDGDLRLPIIVGFLEPLSEDPPESDVAVADKAGQRDMPQVVEADVDGKRVRLVAKDEIVLQCGESSITLRRNGRVVIRGTHIESYSDGTNRIKGGQVRIN
jgi:hypothetical protein